ncbi:MAG TPA: threonine synthase [Bacteroidota bacterium]|nr:threonine synthase [Bacteroidota bacterium]
MTGSSDRGSFITHLECSQCRRMLDHRRVHNVCAECGKALLVRYDLLAAKKSLSPRSFIDRPATLWRYRELLPVVDDRNIVSLGEGFTPILHLRKLGSQLDLPHLYLKDEAGNPTGSFKARGLCMAVSKAKELGIGECCIPTAGNAGGALAAYGASAGLVSHIFLPEETPRINIEECKLYGADVHLVPGNISNAAKAMNAASNRASWFDMSTLKEPYRLEGKKTMGYEIAEQFGWSLPDVIIYPTGGGTGLIGMWKAFAELRALGWIDGSLPRMVSVQSSGCAPIVKAFDEGAAVSEFWENAQTCAAGLRVPKAFADHLILDTLYSSNGHAVAVRDDELLTGMKTAARHEGLLLSPEGAATIAALHVLRQKGIVEDSTRVLLFNTGSGFKYAEVLSRVAL